MGLWIVEPKGGPHVPGTVRLYENNNGNDTSTVVGEPQLQTETKNPIPRKSALKHGDGKDSSIFLVPQPSDSPNDPLNWPMWKKELTLFIICFASAIAGSVGPTLSPVNAVIVEEFKTTYTIAANLSGYQFLASGGAGLLCEAIARLYGKRPVYILSVAFLLAGSLWNVFVQDIGSFMGARVLQGVGLGVFETLIVSSIGDMYFVHQRGTRIALYNFLFLGTVYVTPVLAGRISTLYGWRAQFKIISAILGVAFILVLFFCPEHAYNRPSQFETDCASGRISSEEVTSFDNISIGENNPTQEKPKTFLQELKIYNGRFSNESFFKLILAPFPCMLYPATIWAFLIQGTFLTWGIGIAIVISGLFAGPPTFFTPEQVGYLFLAPTIGAIFAYIAGSFLVDSLAKWLTRKNNNIYEPEFRIVLIVPVLLTGIPGLIGFGYAVEAHVHWSIPSFLYALLTFAVVLSSISTYSYVLDAHRDLSVEMVVAVLLLKNTFAFGSTFYIVEWVFKGPIKSFGAMGGIQAGCCVLSIGMYCYGKRLRLWMHKIGIMKRLGMYPGQGKKTQSGGARAVEVGQKV